jgi:hypothetical protein
MKTILTALAILTLSSCATVRREWDATRESIARRVDDIRPTPDKPDAGADHPGAEVTLPPAPVPPNPSAPREHEWYWAWKSYDGTFRVRWPSYYHDVFNLDSRSYTLINGERARFRGIWRDDGVSRRPSYTIPGPRDRFRGPALIELYNNDGKKVGEFRVDANKNAVRGRIDGIPPK